MYVCHKCCIVLCMYGVCRICTLKTFPSQKSEIISEEFVFVQKNVLRRKRRRRRRTRQRWRNRERKKSDQKLFGIFHFAHWIRLWNGFWFIYILLILIFCMCVAKLLYKFRWVMFSFTLAQSTLYFGFHSYHAHRRNFQKAVQMNSKRM